MKRREGESAPADAVIIGSLGRLKELAAGCTRCSLYLRATQTVFGHGAAHAEVCFVGEQPGDEEDLQGRPFIGPAGKLLDSALEAAEVPKEKIYVTNAVKHFKWLARGKRRLHQKPRANEIAACRIWLMSELAALKPRIVVCLGTTAARSVLGREVKISRERGVFLPSAEGYLVFLTVHPAAILRLTGPGERESAFRQLVDELSLLREHIGRSKRSANAAS